MADEAVNAQEAKSDASKKKKINKLKTDELKKKIEDLETSGHIKSQYYQDLVSRRKELTGE